MSKLKIAGVPERGFCRCGRHFPHEGITVTKEQFSADQWTVLWAERNLRITPIAPEQEVAKARLSRDALLAKAITELGSDDFGVDGSPKVSALNAAVAALSDGEAEKVTGDERDAAWAAALGEQTAEGGLENRPE